MTFWSARDAKNTSNLTKMKRKAVACNAYTIALSSHFSATPCLFECIYSILLLAGAGYGFWNDFGSKARPITKRCLFGSLTKFLLFLDDAETMGIAKTLICPWKY